MRARDEELRRMFDRVVAAKERARAKRLELEEQTDFLEREKGRRIHILRPIRRERVGGRSTPSQGRAKEREQSWVREVLSMQIGCASAALTGHPFITLAKFLRLCSLSPLCLHFTQPISTVICKIGQFFHPPPPPVQT